MTDVALQAAPEIPDKLYFKIGEVAELLGVEPYVLRYWETEFPVLSPKKSGTGHRLYRRKDVELLLRIKHLLRDKRFTIEEPASRCRPKPRRRNASGEAKQSQAGIVQWTIRYRDTQGAGRHPTNAEVG